MRTGAGWRTGYEAVGRGQAPTSRMYLAKALRNWASTRHRSDHEREKPSDGRSGCAARAIGKFHGGGIVRDGNGRAKKENN
ncbi:hypothetical protein RB195_001330 [Necator americanus]|uniref:Uncharacterized protein n=1 Tax=Necator americanus TaxID=51031 RepID=A0ABR1DE67_NECAM